MMNTCIVKSASSCFSSGSPSLNRSNSYSPSSYSNSIHYRESTSSNPFVNIENTVELHDLTSRTQQLSNNVKPDVSDIYHHQIQQIQRHHHHHHHLNHNALSNHPHLTGPHLINHNLTNHLTNSHLINHNLANHAQFATHHQLDDIFTSVAAAAVANLSQNSSSPSNNSTSNNNAVVAAAAAIVNQTNANSGSSSNNANRNSNQNNNSNILGVDSTANDQVDVNQQNTKSPSRNQIYSSQHNNMISNFQYHHQQNSFSGSPSLPQQQQHLQHSNNQLHGVQHSINSAAAAVVAAAQHQIQQQQNSNGQQNLSQQAQQQQLNGNNNSIHHHLQSLAQQQQSSQGQQQSSQNQQQSSNLLQQQHCSFQALQAQQHDGNLSDLDFEELGIFAERFKQRRIKLGVTQSDVGRALANLKIPGVSCLSQSTICRFESLTLSHNNMVSLKPILSSWLDAAENAARSARIRDSLDVSNLSAISPNGNNGLSGLGVMSGLLCNVEKKRKRTSIAAPEKRTLESFFNSQPKPNGEKIAALADQLELTKSVVRVWFCNQRQKLKRMKNSASSG